jgi:hypothetical protein
MRNVNKISSCLLSMLVLLTFLVAAKTSAQPNGQWDFDSGNLNATVGSALQYADGPGGATQLGTQFGTTTALGIPNINGTPANVMGFPIATNGMGYLMPDPANGNGGGTQVNEWTLIMDVLYPSASGSIVRPIIDTDGSIFVPGPDILINAAGGIGLAPNGPFDGSIQPNQWYRIGVAVTAAELDLYVNGDQVGTMAGAGLDGQLALSAGATSLILGTTFATNGAAGYVNSIQLRTNALNPGQMLALGGPSASGIPQIIPPVPSFIQTRTPAPNATGIGPTPSINIVLNQGDTTVNGGSIQLFFDGALLSSSVVATPPTFTIGATVSTLLDPNSSHSLSLTWQDSVAGNKTNTWSFAVLNYQSVTLPTAFYLEDFESVAEGGLPVGWVATNATTQEHTTMDLCDPQSIPYENWLVINTNRLCAGGPCSGFECDTLNQPPIAINGALIDSVAHGNILYFESDNRCNSCYGQIGMLFTADISCTGRTNVFVGFHSLYTQNQDNIAALEYSIDQGVNWLPVIYYLDDQAPAVGGDPDVIYTNGVIDVGATFNTPRADQPANGTNYGWFICAPITTALIPYVAGRTNDDQVSGKRIEVVRLTHADGQANVRFRFVYGGTCSWYWGVDDFGLYEINTPVITTEPVSQSIDAGTPVTFTVVASSPSPLSYQWKHNGANIAGATASAYSIANVQPANGGQYQVIVRNSSGATPSTLATLTVNTNPVIGSPLVSQVADPGNTISFAPPVTGGRPLTFLWYRNGSLIPGTTTTTLTLNNVQTGSSAQYQLILTNTYGSATSSVAQLTVFIGPITNNLVAHLPFDGNFNDTSGRGNNATYAFNGASADTTPTFVGGKIGQCFEYTTLIDGTKFDYATFGYPTDLQLDSTVPFSVSMWLNYTNQSDDLAFISNKDWNSSNDQGWGIFCQSGGNFRNQVTGPSSSDKFSVSPSVILRDGTWHHLLVSFVRAPGSQAGYVYSYVDGVLVNRSTMVTQGTIDTLGTPFTNEQGPGGSPLPTNQADWALNIGQDGTGVYHDQGSAYNIGAHIDDLGIWRRALTAAEARAIYLAGQAGHDLSQAVAARQLTIAVSGNNAVLSWVGNPTLKLQKTTSLNLTSWTDVPGTLGASSANVPLSPVPTYFKLAQ